MFLNIIAIAELVYLIIVVFRVSLRYRYISLYLYLLSLLFVLASVVMDFVAPVTKLNITILDRNLDVIDFLFSNFLLFGIVLWGLAIHFSDYDELSWVIITFLAVTSAIMVGELFEASLFSQLVNLILEIAGLVLFGYFVVRHYLRLRWGLNIAGVRRLILYYLAGFLALIILGSISLAIVIYNPATNSTFGKLWLLGLIISLSLSGILFVKHPVLLLMNVSRPKKFILTTIDGTSVLSLSFVFDSEGLNDEFVGSALSGVSSLLAEITRSSHPLESIGFGEYKIIVSSKKKLVGYLFVERSSKIIRDYLERIMILAESTLEDYVDEGLVFVPSQVIKNLRIKISEMFPYIS